MAQTSSKSSPSSHIRTLKMSWRRIGLILGGIKTRNVEFRWGFPSNQVRSLSTIQTSMKVEPLGTSRGFLNRASNPILPEATIPRFDETPWILDGWMIKETTQRRSRDNPNITLVLSRPNSLGSWKAWGRSQVDAEDEIFTWSQRHKKILWVPLRPQPLHEWVSHAPSRSCQATEARIPQRSSDRTRSSYKRQSSK